MEGLVRARYRLKQTLLLALIISVVAAAKEDDQVEDVAAKAEARNYQHELAIDLGRVEQTVHSLDQKPYEQRPNDCDATECANNIRSLVSICVLQCCWFSRQVDSHEGNDEACNITKLVRSVTEYSKRA